MKKVTLSVIIFAFAASSITLWLLESPLKYILFFLEVALILTVYHSLSGNFKKIRFKIKGNTISKLALARKLDYAFLATSLMLLALNIFRSNNTLSLVFAIIVSFFLPGYVLLRLLKFHSLNTWLEWLVLAFALSIGLTSLIVTLVLPFTTHRAILISAIYIGISLSPLLKDRIGKSGESLQIHADSRVNKHDLFDALLLLWVSLFFIIVISSLYPQMAYRPGLDIVRHFSSSRLLMLAPGAYQSPYPWFHLTWAAVYELASPLMGVFQTGLAYLSLIVVFSFYIMARAYLKDVDRRAPILATVFFSVFSGFGWLHFLGEKLTTLDPGKHLDILRASNDASYWDIGYGQGPWIWLWFRPLTLGVIGLFTLLYLLKRTDINKRSFLILAYFAVLSLGMVHSSELIFYTILLFTLSLFLTPAVQIRLKDSLYASLLAAISILVFLIFYNFIGLRIQFAVFAIAIPIALFALSILIVKLRQRLPNLTSHILKINTTHIYYVTTGLSALWLAMLLYWFTNTDNFHVSMVSSVLAVPWILYPVLLGICGLLTFSGIFYMAKHYRNDSVIIFVAIFIVGIIFGRLLTYINLQYFLSGYWERRFIPLTFSASTIIASLSVFHIIKKMQSKLIISSLLLSLLVVTGLTSTALSIEHQMLATQKFRLTSDELSQISLLNELNSNSYLLTFSSHSLLVAEYAAFAWRIGYFRDHIWPATSPELVLNALFSTEHTAVIYLSEEDYAQLLTAPYSEGYVTRHLLYIAPLVYNSAKASIYDLQAIAPPAENSYVVLVMSENDSDPNSLYAYDVMSLSGYNYTTAYISDVQTLSKAEIIVVPSEIVASKILELKNDLQLNFNKLIVLNLDGYYGELAELNYPSVNVVLASTNFGDASFRDPIHQQYGISTNVSGSGFTPFILEAIASNNSLILADDEASGFWSVSASLEGNLSLPNLTDDSELKASGENSLKIEVSNGSYAQWQISGEFSNTTNLEAHDFISFYWYGEGDGVKYVVQVNTNTPGRYFWYEFTDSWKGWKKVILPMHIADGSYTLYGVKFGKVTKEASWRSAKKIDFKLSAANLNIGGIFHIDRFAFERSVLVNLRVAVHGNLQAFELLNLNQNTYIPIAQINVNGTVSIPEYYMSNGLSSKSILGENAGNLTFTLYNDTYSEAFIQIKVPTTSDESYPVQATFAIAPTYKTNKESSISGEWGSITLPTEINLTPFESSANVIAHYDDEAKTFFAFETSYDQVDLTYLNFHPIIDALESGSRELYSIIGNVTKSALGNLSSYTYKDEPINAGNTAAFREATLQGNVTVSFESIIIQTENSGSLEVIIDEDTTYRLEGNEKISPANFRNAVMKTTYMEILPGNGFYIKAFVQNATLTLYGEPINLVSFLNDHSIDSLKGNVMTIKMENATILLRRPLIDVDGQGSFKDLYTYHELNRRIGTLGDDCEISGHFTFTGIYGDTYSVTKNFDYVGNVKLSEPLYGYDEWQSFVEMLPYLFIVAISYLTFAAQKILRKRD